MSDVQDWNNKFKTNNKYNTVIFGYNTQGFGEF